MFLKNDPPLKFKEGIRVVSLIERGKHANNKRELSIINKIMTHDKDSFDTAVEVLLRLQSFLNNPEIRIYSSINQRDLIKSIKYFQHRQIDTDADTRTRFYTLINDQFCSALMQPEHASKRLFLLDYDSKDINEIHSFIAESQIIKPVYTYETKNGYHIITEPFNAKVVEYVKNLTVMKDGLMLLNWIDVNK